MRAMDRHKARVAALTESPMEGAEEFFHGEASQDVKTYLPMAAGVVAEVASSQLKKKEEAEALKKLKESDAYKAEEAAKDARKRADLARADASGESNPDGPLHRNAADLETKANVAEQRAFVYRQQAMQAAAAAGGVPGGAMVPSGRGGDTLFTPRNLMIGGGILAGLILVIVLARK